MPEEKESLKAYLGLDDLDLKILEIISQDARKSFREIGIELKKSPVTIKNRIIQMENNNIIKSWGASLNYDNLGHDLMAIVELSVEKEHQDEIQKNLEKSPHVFGVYDITGETDIIVIIRVKNRKELSSLVKNLFSSKLINKTITHVVLNIVKDDYNSQELLKNI